MGFATMSSDSALQAEVGRVADRYSLLFTLPSLKIILTYTFAVCMVGGIIASVSYNSSLYGLASGFLLGGFLFFATLFSNYLDNKVFMRSDPILDFRRCSFLSIPSCIILFLFVSVANIFGVSGDLNLWAKIAAAGLFAVLLLRLLVLSSVSSVSYWRIHLSAFLQPVLFLIFLSIFPITEHGFRLYLILPFSISVLFALFGIHLFVSRVNAIGEESFGIKSLLLFKAFLANWTEDLNKPLEDFFEKFGEERDVKVSLLAFKAKNRMKAVIVVPAIHPGPFKNVGSSPLPGMIQASLEDKLKCVVSVPHGTSGHDLDLASQIQNRRIIDRIVELTEFETFDSYATPFVRSEVGGAKASCQIFGKCALFTLTLAPETMEDLPRKLDYAIIQEAKKRSLATAITIDAHNSIRGPFDPERAVEPLRKAAVKALEKAVKAERYSFEVGAAKVHPTDFNIEDGMGPGGISVLIVKVGDQKVAYVTIDGNNMVSGLREDILSRFRVMGLTDGEVITTDTHVVNGVVKVDRGYYPVGEAIDREKLIKYIEKAVSEALGNLEATEVSWRIGNIPKVKIIGEKQLRKMCVITDKIVKITKNTAMFLFPSLAVLLTIIFVFI